MPKAITDSSFEQDIEKHSGYALVDFWAEWCGPCRQMGPLLEKLQEEMGDKLLVAKMNVDSNTEVPTKFMIRGIPAFILFKDGNVVDTKVGAMSYGMLKEWIESAMG